MRNFKNAQRNTESYGELLVLAAFDKDAEHRLKLRITKLLNESQADELNINFGIGNMHILRTNRKIDSYAIQGLPEVPRGILNTIVNNLLSEQTKCPRTQI